MSVGEIIVLADDEADLRAVYASALRGAGYRVFEAADGDEALRVVHEHRPGLLLLDVWMPVANGYEVLERMRHDALAGSMKVVMLSNLDDADSRLEGFSAGVADYWIKGLPLVDLLEKVGLMLAGSRAEPELA